MSNTIKLKQLFTVITLAAGLGLASLPAQAQEAPVLTGIDHILSAKGDGVDNRQCKALKRIGAELPGYCF
ncbi:hypothetical protein LL240_16955 [Oceanimonas baumannii]|uniref:hypothetical protein n=1 Tax=Oceanimonas baumannii TaxID=129578 RepID=UPI001D186659|nr:hypothetical protein [Oceanimonas baumannii]MCC4266127.1 hypothetical protein [Oceanimonas baumannii]